MCIVCLQISAKIKIKDVKRNLDAKIDPQRDMEYLKEIRVIIEDWIKMFSFI